MNCLIVEDEMLAAELLESNIMQVPFLKVAGKAKNATEAMEILAREQIDLMFLDIRLPGISGIELLRTMINPPIVIFVTALQEHALAGYEMDVVDFLVKPVPPSRFLAAIQKAQRRYRKIHRQEETDHDDFVFVNANYSLVRVNIKDIAYIEGLRDYSRIHLASGTFVITRIGLKSIEDRLNSNRFIRVHKSYIVALDKIESVQKAQLTVMSKEIPVGDGYKELIFRRINEKNL